MHIPNGMLQGSVCPVTSVISAIGLVAASYFAVRSERKPTAFRFAAVTAFIFAAQMVNFPVLNGTSGHLLGGVLAAIMLGIPFGVISIALVLTIQCLVFADGGLSALGANIFNMALLGAGVGGWLANRTQLSVINISRAGLLSVVLAAAACSLELAWSGTIALGKVLPAMIFVHAIIGVGEGILAALIWKAFSLRRDADGVRSSTIMTIAAAVVAFVLAPFASSWPDGLEWVAERYQFLHESAPTFVTPLADYAVASMGDTLLSVSIAGMIGVTLAFASAWLAARCLRSS